MLFSIIIPLYNKAPYVDATIRSVLAQTEKDFEVVVVDDGSKDGGAEVVRSLTREDSRVSLHQILNGGVSRARNHGIDLARGEWVAFLDADDWHHPQYLETLRRTIQQHSEVHIAATHYHNVASTEELTSSAQAQAALNESIEIIRDLPVRWTQSSTFFTSSVAVRTDFLRKHQPCFPPGESHGEDLDLWLRLAEESPVALHPGDLVRRLLLEDSLSAQQQSKLEEPPFLRRLEERAQRHGSGLIKNASLMHFVMAARIDLARQALLTGRRSVAAAILFKNIQVLDRRWWLTAIMTLYFTPTMTRQWLERRKK